jgi:hypothetical protein
MKHFLFFSFIALCFILVGREFYESELLGSMPGQASGFGISPPTLIEYIKPSEEIGAHINLLRSAAGAEFAVAVEPALNDLTSWVTVESAPKFLKDSTMAPAYIKIKAPADAEPGIYRGDISFIAAGDPSSGVTINLGAVFHIELTVTGPVAAAREFSLAREAGIWEKYRGQIIDAAPGYYYIHTAKPIAYALTDEAAVISTAAVTGLGITNRWLKLIPVGLINAEARPDSDRDGLTDATEDALATDRWRPDTDDDGHPDRAEIEAGYDPLGNGMIKFDPALADRLAGRIIMQVESRGEAWYVNPADQKRYFLGDKENIITILSVLAQTISPSERAAIFP